jgi:CRISPR-associated Cas5-like protein
MTWLLEVGIMQALLIRLAGYTAHFRDPRINTAKIGLPSRTLRCPPPCTLHGLLCAARGGWVEPESLRVGWRIDYASIGIDFQTSLLPQRKREHGKLGVQTGIKISPVEREFLAFPILSILVISGVESLWFRSPVNPLSLGRSEDLIVEKRLTTDVAVEAVSQATVSRQCLPMGTGSGTIYAAPLYFVGDRQPVDMQIRIDAEQEQSVRSSELVQISQSREAFYVWNFGASIGEKRETAHLPG